MLLRIAKYLLIGGLFLCSSICYGKSWPVVRPISKSFEVSDSGHANIQLLIQDKAGKSIYKAVCFPGDHTEHDFDYSGLVQCRLIDLGTNAKSPDLLTQPNATRDWLSRGKFEVSELTGNCVNDSDFGPKRIFLLRGMRFEIQVGNLKEIRTQTGDGGRNTNFSYVLSFSVANDKAAQRPSDRRLPLPANGVVDADCSQKQSWWDK